MDSIIKFDNDYGKEIAAVTADNFIMIDKVNFDAEINIKHPGWDENIIKEIADVYGILLKYLTPDLIKFHVEKQLPIMAFNYKEDENTLYFISPYRKFTSEISEFTIALRELMNTMALNMNVLDKNIIGCGIAY